MGSFLNGEKKLTIPWPSDLSILVYEHGSPRSPSLSTSMDLRPPSLSMSMEIDLSRPSVFFLIEKIDPLESIFLTR